MVSGSRSDRIGSESSFEHVQQLVAQFGVELRTTAATSAELVDDIALRGVQ